MLSRLRNQTALGRLRDFESGGRGVVSALEVSYDQLDDRQQRLFRLLGMHPGADFDAYAAAALAGIDPQDAELILERLVDAHVLESQEYGRYTFHDLLRAHAANTAARVESETERNIAMGGLLDHYLYAASRAMDAYAPAERHRRPMAPTPVTASPDVDDHERAMHWLKAERANLVAVAGYAADHGWPGHASFLSTCLYRYLDNAFYSSDALALHRHALRASRARGDRSGEAKALYHLALTYIEMGSHADSLLCLQRALSSIPRDDEQLSRATILGWLGLVLYRMGRFSDALQSAEQAAELHRARGDRSGEAQAMRTLGYVSRCFGRLVQAERFGLRALALARETGDRSVVINTLNFLGGTYCTMARYDDALDKLRTALELGRKINFRTSECMSLFWLGRTYQGAGRYEEALDHYGQSLDAARRIDDRNSEFEAELGIGETMHLTGRANEAVPHLHAAVEMAQAIEQEHDEARAQEALGHALRDTGELAMAREHWREALRIYEKTGVPEADRVRSCLSGE